jgi:hypothetical protein
MQVRCKINTGNALPPKYFEVSRRESKQTVYHISMGKEYTVFAIALWQSAIMFLISDDTDLPNWYSSEFFSVTEAHLPEGWAFRITVAREHGVRRYLGLRTSYRRSATLRSIAGIGIRKH